MNSVYVRNGQQVIMQQVVMGLMNENDVVIHEGIDRDDRLYLSMPQDTAGIEKRLLSDDILKKYEQKEDSIQQEQDQQDLNNDGPERRRQMGRSDDTGRE
jgi:hypothetical protein